MPLPLPILARLKAHKVNQRSLRLALGKDWAGATDANGQGWDLVFTDSYGRLIRRHGSVVNGGEPAGDHGDYGLVLAVHAGAVSACAR